MLTQIAVSFLASLGFGIIFNIVDKFSKKTYNLNISETLVHILYYVKVVSRAR